MEELILRYARVRSRSCYTIITNFKDIGTARMFCLLVLQLKDFDEPYTAETVGAGEMGRVCARI
jgi:hypothetical protein